MYKDFFLNKWLKFNLIIFLTDTFLFQNPYNQGKPNLLDCCDTISVRIKRTVISGKSKDMCGYVIFLAIRTGLLHDIISYITSPGGWSNMKLRDVARN